MRLIDDPAGRGAWNMALDEALLDRLATGLGGPTLRFYGWDPPTLSLGYSQPLADVDFAACDRLGVDVVRRPTGGRAVLHVAELTYSVTGPAGQESVAQSYCRISRAIARAIGRMGVAASLEPGSKVAPESAGRGGAIEPECADSPESIGCASPGAAGILPAPRAPTNRSADCFAISTSADLLAAGRKIVGSAQVRRRGFLLQHGSVKLAPAPIAIGEVLRSPPKASAPAVLAAAPPLATLAELLDQPAEAILDPLKRLIAEELGVPWLPTVPTTAERELARAIEARSSSALRRPDRSGPLRRAAD